MKKLLSIFSAAILLSFGLCLLDAKAAPITPVVGGGTQTSTPPMLGQMLIGNGAGMYNYISSSSLGGSGGGSTTNVFAGTGISVQQVGANATVTNIGVLSVNGATGTVSVSGSFTTTTIAGLVDTVFRVATSGTCFTFSTSSAPSTLTFGWTNCNGYISTSTFNATGSPLYFPYWSSSGNLLTATSNIYAYNATNTGITNYLVVGAASTSNATPENLDVVGTFAVEQPPGNDFFIVNSNGYVGIGSSTPNAPFVFENTSTIPDQFQIVTVNTPHAMLIYNASTTSGGAHISFGNADTGISNANTPDMGITAGGNLYYETYMPNDQVWFTSSTERLRLTSAGVLRYPNVTSSLLWGDASGNIISTTTPAWITTSTLSLTGTTHQVNVSGSLNSYTLSTPQNIDTTSNVTFGTVTNSGEQVNGTTTVSGINATGTVYVNGGTLLVGTSTQGASTTLSGTATIYGQFFSGVSTTVSAATTTLDFSKYERYQVDMVQATTNIQLANMVDYNTPDVVEVCQDGTGSRTIPAWSASGTNVSTTVQWGTQGTPTLSTTAFACDFFSFLAMPDLANNTSIIVHGFYGMNGFSH